MMNKFKQFFKKVIEEIKKVLEVIQDFVLSLLTPKEEHTLYDDFEFSSFIKVTTVPSTFVKTFVYDYVEELDDKVNHYAEDNKVEIKSILVNQTKLGVLYATVIFERGGECG